MCSITHMLILFGYTSTSLHVSILAAAGSFHENIFLFSPWRSMDVDESGCELPWTPMAIPTVGGRGRIHYYGGP